MNCEESLIEMYSSYIDNEKMAEQEFFEHLKVCQKCDKKFKKIKENKIKFEEFEKEFSKIQDKVGKNEFICSVLGKEKGESILNIIQEQGNRIEVQGEGVNVFQIKNVGQGAKISINTNPSPATTGRFVFGSIKIPNTWVGFLLFLLLLCCLGVYYYPQIKVFLNERKLLAVQANRMILCPVLEMDKKNSLEEKGFEQALVTAISDFSHFLQSNNISHERNYSVLSEESVPDFCKKHQEYALVLTFGYHLQRGELAQGKIRYKLFLYAKGYRPFEASASIFEEAESEHTLSLEHEFAPEKELPILMTTLSEHLLPKIRKQLDKQ